MHPKWLKTSSSACTKQLCSSHSPLYSSVLCCDDEKWGEQVHITGASRSKRALRTTYIEFFFFLVTPVSLAQCTSSPACPDLCTLYTLFLLFLCVKSCVYEDQSHFGYDAVLTADIPASVFRILTGLDEYSCSWMTVAMYRSTWPYILRRLQSSSTLLWQPQMLFT